MIRTALVLIAAIAILLVGQWTRMLRTENEELKAKVAELKKQRSDLNALYAELYTHYMQEHPENANETKAPPPAPTAPNLSDLQRQLVLEKSKLDTLKKVRSGNENASALERRMARDQSQIAELEKRLSRLSQDTQAVDENSSRYRQDQAATQSRDRQTVQDQLHSVEMAEAETRGQLQVIKGDRAKEVRQQLSQLTEQHHDLTAELRKIDHQARATDAAIRAEVQSEKAEVSGERSRLQDRIDHLKADLESARKSKTKGDGGGAAGGNSQEILRQTAKVQSLENQIQTLSESKEAKSDGKN